MLDGLTIGAPPDPLGPLGQNWSITSFSPQGLQETGYAPWIAMIRAGLSAGGGLRIDHAFGLARLWVIPEGGATRDGAYLSYPFEDLIRLATLEAHRADALVIVTEWDAFRALDFNRIKAQAKAPVLIDLRNVYDPGEVRAKGFSYVSVGRP